jgi:large subunit ribosomal protein L10
MKRQEKGAAVADLRQSVEAAAGMVLADFTGLDVPTMLELRRLCRNEDVAFQVVKNTLARRAFSEAGLAGLERFLTGPTALAYSTSDAVAPARALWRFREEHGRPEFKAGYVEGRVLDSGEVTEVATLPSREELLAKVVGTLASPIRGLVHVLGGPLRGMVRVLSEVSQRTPRNGEEGAQ